VKSGSPTMPSLVTSAARQVRRNEKAPPRNSATGLSKHGARDRARTGDPHVGKEMVGLISLRNFARTDQIGSFRSIVGEAVSSFTDSLLNLVVVDPPKVRV